VRWMTIGVNSRVQLMNESSPQYRAGMDHDELHHRITNEIIVAFNAFR